jgi:hypothetical protein
MENELNSASAWDYIYDEFSNDCEKITASSNTTRLIIESVKGRLKTIEANIAVHLLNDVLIEILDAYLSEIKKLTDTIKSVANTEKNNFEKEINILLGIINSLNFLISLLKDWANDEVLII